MNLAAWCIRNNRTAIVSFLLVAAAGVSTFLSISRLEDPEFTIRTALVVVRFPGASPVRVEQLVIDPIEKGLREIPEVEDIRSKALTGVAFIYADVSEKHYDMPPIWTKLRNKIDDIKGDLPEEALDPVVNDEFGDVFGVVFAMTGDGFTYREMKDIAEGVRDELYTVPNVAKVELHGVQEERIFVEFSNARFAEYGYSPYQLAQILSSQNIIQASGDALVGSERVILETTGEFQSVEDLQKMSLRIPGRSEAVTLENIATVRRGFVDPPSTMTRIGGEESIVVAVNMAKGGNIIEMGQAVQDKIAQLERDLPVGIDFHVQAFQPKFVDRSIRDFMVNLYEAFLLVVFVVLLAAGWRTGLVVGSLVPMAILMCIALMPLFDIELQKISIASLIISLGMLVDNGVVVSENILVRIQKGQERLLAATGSVTELWKPLLAASLTTIFAFLPIGTAKSAVGEYCLSLFQVVSITLLSSWLISLTLVPLLCYFFLQGNKVEQKFSGRFYKGYRNFLTLCLKRRDVFLVTSLLVLLGGVFAFSKVPVIFFPPNEREMFYIDFWQPYGTDIGTTSERAKKLETFLLSQEGTESVAVSVGAGGPRWYLSLNPEPKNPNYAFFLINTKTIPDSYSLQEKTAAFLDENFPECRHTVSLLENGPPVGAPIQIRISGKKIESLYAIRDRLEEILVGITGTANIRDDWGEWTKKLVVNINQENAKRAGLTSQDVALSLQTQISGLPATDYREGKEVIPVVLRSKSAYREDLGRVEGLNIYSYLTANSLPLSQIAQPFLTWQPSNIQRRNQQRTMTLKADLDGRFASDVLQELMPKVKEYQNQDDFPFGYKIEIGGEHESSAEAQESIFEGFPLAFGLIILLLISQFNSLRRPLIILLTIPPMIVGIAGGLLLTDAPFGFMAMLGMISLMGIIVNNAIMMIDRIEIERRLGQTIQDAIVVSAQKRLRPIITTAVTTILGLIPLSLQGGEFWRPMANTLIFGLGFATVLTLVLCPVLYSLFFRSSFKDWSWSDRALEKSTD